MAEKLTLYRSNGACSFAPHSLLIELNIPFQDVNLKYDGKKMFAADGSLSHEEYRKINPSGFVPALRVRDELITEMPAVISYICNLAPEKNLLGSTNVERAKALEWMVWLGGTVSGDGFAALWRPDRYTKSVDEKVLDAIKAGGKRNVLTSLALIESRLNGVHAVGGTFTAVDVHLYIIWRWAAGKMEHDMKGEFPRYSALVRDVEQRDSVVRTLKAEEMAPAF